MSGRERFNFCEGRDFFSVYRAIDYGIAFCLCAALALCRPQERGRQCAKMEGLLKKYAKKQMNGYCIIEYFVNSLQIS